MCNFSSNNVYDHHDKTIFVKDDPYQYAHIKEFLPDNLIEKVCDNFRFPIKIESTSDALFQKTKRGLNDYKQFPEVIQNFIDHLNSEKFVNILENKFNIRGLLPDPTLFGGGMHESRKGGYLKLHSDFIYIRKRKVKRMLNLLIYLNKNWDENWGGAIELWDQKMENNFLKVYPHINSAVVFRTDTESNHGFPDPITCPENEGRKSIAVYYYIKENSIFKRTKYFYARWKRRPGVDEPKFGDNRNIIEKLKNKFFFRFK
tara:strand:- start:51 stop:827 length:777 start_codon:yes stop_codon:yes gene_type:complete